MVTAVKSVPSASTCEALTGPYSPRVIVDNVFTGTPALTYFRRNLLSMAGLGWEPTVEIDYDSGAWVNIGGQMSVTTPAGDIATIAHYPYYYFYRPVLLEAQHTDGQGAQKLIDLMGAQTRSAIKSVGKSLNTAIYTGNPAATPNEMNSLNIICDNVAVCGLLDPTASGYEYWMAHVMEGTSTFATAVSPSLENISKQNRSIANTCGEKVDITLVAEDYWDTLRSQITSNDYLLAKAAAASSAVVKWGFDAMWVDGVPIISDRDCSGEAWVTGQATRAAAKGYQSFSLNFNYVKMAYNPKRAFKWDPDGWVRPDDYDRYLNKLYFWGTLGTTQRRAQGRMFNVDIAQDETNWVLGDVTLPGP